jgi:hypothetical protein
MPNDKDDNGVIEQGHPSTRSLHRVNGKAAQVTTVMAGTTLSGTFQSVDFSRVNLQDANLSGEFYDCQFLRSRRSE